MPSGVNARRWDPLEATADLAAVAASGLPQKGFGVSCWCR